MAYKKANPWPWIILIALVVIVVGGGYLMYSQTALPGTGKTGGPIQVTQTGKSSSLVTTAYDRAGDNQQTTINNGLDVYTFYADNGEWKLTEDDGTDTGTSGSVTSTTGIATGGQAMAFAFNDSYTCLGSGVINIKSEGGESVNLDCFRVASSLIYYFTNETSTTRRADTGVVTVPAGVTKTLSMEVEMNQSNRGFWYAGFYFDVLDGTNLSDLDVSEGQIVPAKAGHVKVAGSGYASPWTTAPASVGMQKNVVNLASQTNDDYVFTLSTPVILFEADKIKWPTVSVTSDGGGFGAETISGHTMDFCPDRSQLEPKVIWGYEDDATSPTACGGVDQRFSVVAQT